MPLYFKFKFPYGLVTQNKKRWKIKIGIDVPYGYGTSKWSATFQLKRSKVKVTRRQNPKEIARI